MDITDPAALDALVATLGDEHGYIRAAAADALWNAAMFGRSVGPAAGDALLAIIREDDDWRCRSAAAQALWRIKPSKPVAAVEALTVAVRDDDDARVRATAAGSLWTIGAADSAAVEALAAAVRDDGDAAVRVAAGDALGRVRPDDPTAASALLEALHQDLPKVRVVVARSLASIRPGEEAAFLALIELVQNSDSTVAHLAERALEELGAVAMPVLVRALQCGQATFRVVRSELDDELHTIIRELLADRKGADQLRVFFEVAQAGSFNAAADTLGMSNATAARRVVKNKLEDRLRQCLRVKTLELVRSATRKCDGIVLTEIGKTLAGWLYGQFGDLDGGFDETRAAASRRTKKPGQ